MEIGALRYRVVIKTVTATQDAYGQESGDVVTAPSGATFATVWGEVRDVSGVESFTAAELHSQITTRITVRFYPGILPSMIASVAMDARTRNFDILAVTDPEGRKRTLVLDCKERFD